MEITVIATADGSNTLYHKVLDETYHSHRGALTESKHVFIANGLDFVVSGLLQHAEAPSIRILEIGLGTGLNAMLSAQYAQANTQKITYVGLEPFPLSWQLIEQTDYLSYFKGETGAEAGLAAGFRMLHEAPQESPFSLHPHFELIKKQCRLEDFSAEASLFDLVYFDAFAPKKQPELWEQSPISRCYELLKPAGVLVSYCASGQFKRNLKAAGFTVENLQGPPGGKREMTRAIKPR